MYKKGIFLSFLILFVGCGSKHQVSRKNMKKLSDQIVYKDAVKRVYNQVEDVPAMFTTLADKSLIHLEKSLLEEEQNLGKSNLELIFYYNRLASLCIYLEKQKKAESYLLKSLSCSKIHFGEAHHETAMAYNNLAFFQSSTMGAYEQSLHFLHKSLAIHEKIVKKGHPYLIDNYYNLGLLYGKIGKSKKALDFYKKSLMVNPKALSKEYLSLDKSYAKLGAFYFDMGDYTLALEFLEKSIDIANASKRFKIPEIIETYNQMACVYRAKEAYPMALKFHKKSLNEKNKMRRPARLNLAYLYSDIATTYMALNKHIQALDFYKKAWNINKKSLEKNHPKIAENLNNIGMSYIYLTEYDKALKCFEEALEIKKKRLPLGHPSIAETYYSMGVLYAQRGDYAQAFTYISKDFNLFLENRDKSFNILNQEQKKKYAHLHSKKRDLFLSVLKKNLESGISQVKKHQLLQSGMSSWLNYKGSIFDSENSIVMLYEETKNLELKEKIKRLLESKRKLAQLYQSLPRGNEKRQWSKNIKTLEEGIDSLTNEIAQEASSFREDKGLRSIVYSDISKHLKRSELYVDYIRTIENYYIFTLDSKGRVGFVKIDKGETLELEALVTAFRNDVEEILKASNISSMELAELTKRSKEKLSQLYILLIEKPLDKKLIDKKSLIVSPDGLLRLLPFEALYNAKRSTYLLEQKKVRYIPSGKELLRLYKYTQNKASNKKVTIFSNPNFNSKLRTSKKEKLVLTPHTNRSGIIKSLFKMRFDALEGTAKEAASISTILGEEQVLNYSKEEATEQNLLKVKNPKILHIATHGFFLNDKSIPNPMLKSGIALTGANASAIRGKSDGIVTALKLSGLDLTGTDLVVLSACKTGVVDMDATESVSGLSKAFIQAGTKNIVMSLWSVDDKKTQALMTEFYREMKTRKSYSEALRDAKLKMIKEHPFFWAGFILSGV